MAKPWPWSSKLTKQQQVHANACIHWALGRRQSTHTTARPGAASCRCAGGFYDGKTSAARAHATWPASAPIQPQPRQRFKAARHRAKAIGEAARIPVRLEPLGSEWQRLSRLSSPILPRALPHASAAARSSADQSCAAADDRAAHSRAAERGESMSPAAFDDTVASARRPRYAPVPPRNHAAAAAEAADAAGTSHLAHRRALPARCAVCDTRCTLDGALARGGDSMTWEGDDVRVAVCRSLDSRLTDPRSSTRAVPCRSR